MTDPKNSSGGKVIYDKYLNKTYINLQTIKQWSYHYYWAIKRCYKNKRYFHLQIYHIHRYYPKFVIIENC